MIVERFGYKQEKQGSIFLDLYKICLAVVCQIK